MGRSYCYQCQRVQQACLCQQITVIDNPVSVYVLQHPDESRVNKGTAIIAKLSLKNYTCWVGEDFSSHEALNQLLESQSERVAIVYPSEHAQTLQISANASARAGEDGLPVQHLIFIDATWRKAKKIWSLSTNLHKLPAIKLDSRQSNYRIRKIPADGYLSTVEAIVESLSVLDADQQKYEPMLDVFDSMIDYQIKLMGEETYNKNYEK